jgi:hypothetical protein
MRAAATDVKPTYRRESRRHALREEGATVRMIRMVGAGVAAVVLATLGTSAAVASTTGPAVKVIPFVASYSGTATVKVTDGVADIVATGPGKATSIGVGKITGVGKGDTTAQPCVPFTGPGTMSGAAGKVTFKVLPGSVGCGDEQGNVFSINGKIAVVKGTGKLLGFKGTLKLTGTYDHGDGTFAIKLSGKLKK